MYRINIYKIRRYVAVCRLVDKCARKSVQWGLDSTLPQGNASSNRFCPREIAASNSPLQNRGSNDLRNCNGLGRVAISLNWAPNDMARLPADPERDRSRFTEIAEALEMARIISARWPRTIGRQCSLHSRECDGLIRGDARSRAPG